jgi:hexosaminidase
LHKSLFIVNMKSLFYRTIFCTLTLLCSTVMAETKKACYQIIPLPYDISLTGKGDFVLNEKTKILVADDHPELTNEARLLSAYIGQSTGNAIAYATANSQSVHRNMIVLGISRDIDHAEGYQLTVDKHSIHIVGHDAAGVFYGIQTLRKSIPAIAHKCKITLPGVIISDKPRFAYRGMHLDCSRHFFPVSFVKKYIDLLALHNMNYFHWHLSDDQGWRIEIKKYPRLTTIGSKRARTVIDLNKHTYDNVPYGGFYTQDEIKDIVAYAAERHITVVPEIDMPGHTTAALAAYPELGCTGGPYEVCTDWGCFDGAFCIGKESTFAFVKEVLDEVMSLFPSKYIHIGGDEVSRAVWKKCPLCQKRITDEGISADNKFSAEDKLQSYFMTRVEKYLNSCGRSIIGWDEILDGEVSPNATVMSWRGTKGGETAAKLKHHVIMTPTNYAYFDYYQIKDKAKDSLSMNAVVTAEDTYNFEPVPTSLTPDEQQYILGAQGNVWTEYITCPANVEFKVLPRMSALAEVQWMYPEKRDYQDFKARLPWLVQLLKRDNYHYAKYILTE